MEEEDRKLEENPAVESKTTPDATNQTQSEDQSKSQETNEKVEATKKDDQSPPDADKNDLTISTESSSPDIKNSSQEPEQDMESKGSKLAESKPPGTLDDEESEKPAEPAKDQNIKKSAAGKSGEPNADKNKPVEESEFDDCLADDEDSSTDEGDAANKGGSSSESSEGGSFTTGKPKCGRNVSALGPRRQNETIFKRTSRSYRDIDVYEPLDRKMKEAWCMNFQSKFDNLPKRGENQGKKTEAAPATVKLNVASILREEANRRKIRNRDYPDESYKKSRTSKAFVEIIPKYNKSFQLRRDYIKQMPIFSQTFLQSYRVYGKPPFVIENAKYCKHKHPFEEGQESHHYTGSAWIQSSTESQTTGDYSSEGTGTEFATENFEAVSKSGILGSGSDENVSERTVTNTSDSALDDKSTVVVDTSSVSPVAPAGDTSDKTEPASDQKNESDSTKNESDSTQNESDPTKNELDPTKNESDPTKNESDPTKNESDPTKNESDSTQNESAPTNQNESNTSQSKVEEITEPPANTQIIYNTRSTALVDENSNKNQLGQKSLSAENIPRRSASEVVDDSRKLSSAGSKSFLKKLMKTFKNKSEQNKLRKDCSKVEEFDRLEEDGEIESCGQSEA